MSYEARSGHGYQYGGPAFPGGILVGIALGIMLGDFSLAPDRARGPASSWWA
jgi:hypothetical protein